MSGLARDRPSLQGGLRTGSFHIPSPALDSPRCLQSEESGDSSEASLRDSCYCIGESQGPRILVYKTVEPMISPLSSLRINTLNLPTPCKACLMLRPSGSPGLTGQGGESTILTLSLNRIISRLCDRITSKTSLGLILSLRSKH